MIQTEEIEMNEVNCNQDCSEYIGSGCEINSDAVAEGTPLRLYTPEERKNLIEYLQRILINLCFHGF